MYFTNNKDTRTKRELRARRERIHAIGLKIKYFQRRVVIFVNLIYTLFGIGTAVFFIGAYAYPYTFKTILGIGQIVQIHVLLGSMIVFGMAAGGIGVLGMQAAYRRRDVLMGVQMALIMILILIQTSIFFSFFTEWEGTMIIGLSMAVHRYCPTDLSSRYMDNIQRLFKCCGARGGLDYNIANVYFPHAHVPVSCCRLEKCSVESHPVGHHNHIPLSQAFQVGCSGRMHEIIYTALIVISVVYLTLESLTLLVVGLHCGLNHRFPDGRIAAGFIFQAVQALTSDSLVRSNLGEDNGQEMNPRKEDDRKSIAYTNVVPTVEANGNEQIL